MSNMSYCRHENTLNDLRDVLEKWTDFDAKYASDREVSARNRLRMLIREMNDKIESEEDDIIGGDDE